MCSIVLIPHAANFAQHAQFEHVIHLAASGCLQNSLSQLDWNYCSGGFQKRDGGRKDTETLASRLVDRCLRPVFKKGWANETQVLAWVYSYDGVHSPEPLAITAASAALAISGVTQALKLC